MNTSNLHRQACSRLGGGIGRRARLLITLAAGFAVTAVGLGTAAHADVKQAGQTTRFAFSYTVTSDDKAAGKITFRADANISNHPDALPADNELLSTPVKV